MRMENANFSTFLCRKVITISCLYLYLSLNFKNKLSKMYRMNEQDTDSLRMTYAL